ncbi:hypothetical protein Nepgr_027239 [Nepenthes gracilis]|uniref:Uncharacterized protein n=1 Tax=Nepenthes gracilis TaxID=150966 RepID=A0AAD3Y3C6_NEPGR|nr:hypothetical protein Nepgr_027239 [Nepenthes gracilis]
MDGHPGEQPAIPIPQSASLSTSPSAQPMLTKTLFVRIPSVFPTHSSHLSGSRTPFSDISPVPVLSHLEGLAGPSGSPIPPLFDDGLLSSSSIENQSDESGGKTLEDDASRIEEKECPDFLVLCPCILPCEKTLSPRFRTLDRRSLRIALRVERLRLAMASCRGPMVLLRRAQSLARSLCFQFSADLWC